MRRKNQVVCIYLATHADSRRLATAGLIESHRYPQFNRGMFGGFAYTYRYRKNLDYWPKSQPVDHWQKKRKQTLIFGIAFFAAAAAALIYLTLLIQKFG